ncbi:MAG: hypothetical protein BWY66_02914 [bacterium ADurb.Bin374]|nr:MAG: hypothetical protein BWY66_02914 [bacterium ADurb.Bin374]
MAEKRVTPRQNRKAERPDKTVVPRWKAIQEGPNTVVLNRASFYDETTGWDQKALYSAKTQFEGKEIFFREVGTANISVDRSRYTDPETRGFTKSGEAKIKALVEKGFKVGVYDMPSTDPSGKRYGETQKITRLNKVDAKKVVRINTAAEKAAREKARAIARAEKEARGLEANLKKLRDTAVKQRDKEQRAIFQKGEKAKTTPAPKKTGPSYTERMRDRSRMLGASKDATKDLLARRRKFLQETARATKAADTLRRDRLRRRAYASAKYAQKAAKTAAKVSGRIQKLSGFGKAPIKFALKGTKLAGRLPGKMAAMKGLTRDQLYPPMRHAGSKPLSPPVSLRGVSGRQTLAAPALGRPEGLSRVAGTSLFATTKTLSAQRFGGPGQGIMFRIDAEETIAMLVQKYPATLKKAALLASDRIGRKLLDIVEPYVPKDTGLLYSTAKTGIAQTSGGLVDMEGGEAYPSGQMFGVTISYNAPYAEVVYFNENAAHGEEYNRKHGTSEKGEKETARWIEVAFEKEKAATASLMAEYALSIGAALDAAGRRAVSFKSASGKAVSFLAWK